MAIGVTNFPTSLDTVAELIEAANNSTTTLNGAIDASVTTITVVSTSSFPSSGTISIDSEIISYTGKTATTFTGCTRGFESTSAASHSDGATVDGEVTARHHNVLASALIVVETKLGSGSSTATSGSVLRGTGAGTSGWGAVVNADIDASAAIAVSKLAAVTASRALVSDINGFLSASSVTATELGYVSGVTSAIQTQLNAKQAAFSDQNANIVYAGPATGAAAAPAFRSLVAADIPDISATYLTVATAASTYQPLDSDLTAIAALSADGLLRKTSGTWAMDSSTYLTGNQTITISGDVSGSGATSITATISNLALSKLAAVTASRALVSDASGFVSASSVTATELGYVSGVTSAIQTQFSGKASTGDVTGSGLTMSTARLLGRSTASTGAIEEITVGSGLSLSGGTLSATGGGGLTVGTTAIASGAAGRILYETSGNVLGEIAGSSADSSGAVQFAASARTSGVAQYFRVNTPADTTLTASTESVGVYIGGNGSGSTVTREWSTGALTTQREYVFVAPTYAFVGASTLTTAATVAITGAPVAGTNATITTPISLLSSVNTNGQIAGRFLSTAANTAGHVLLDVYRNTSTLAFAVAVDAYSSSYSMARYDVWRGTGSATNQGHIFAGSYASWGAGAVNWGPGTSEIGWGAGAGSGYFRVSSTGTFQFNSTGYGALNTPDTALARAAAGVIRLTNASTGAGKLIIGTSSASTSAADLYVVGSSASLTTFRIDSAASPTAPVMRLTNNGTTGYEFWGSYWQVQKEASTDPTTSELTAGDHFAIYRKNDKFVIAYNNAATMTYLTIPLDGSTATWTQSTTAP